MPFKRIRPSYTYQAVEAAIKDYILERGLKAGDPLPSERELCQTLGVSRTSVREGLRSLSMMGLVDVRTGEGTFVRNIDLGKNIKDLSPLLLSEPQNVLDLQEVRDGLEVMACRRAATRITPEQLARMEENIEEYRRALACGEDGIKQDVEFHSLIFTAADNRFLQQLADSIADLVRVIRLAGLRVPGGRQIAADQHRTILKALLSRDPDEAAHAMHAHMQHVSKSLVAQWAAEKE